MKKMLHDWLYFIYTPDEAMRTFKRELFNNPDELNFWCNTNEVIGIKLFLNLLQMCVVVMLMSLSDWFMILMCWHLIRLWSTLTDIVVLYLSKQPPNTNMIYWHYAFRLGVFFPVVEALMHLVGMFIRGTELNRRLVLRLS